MYAHVFQAEVRKERVQEAIEIVRDRLLPDLRKQEGYQRGYLLLDREAGKAELVTVWDLKTACMKYDELLGTLGPYVSDVIVGAFSHAHYKVEVEDPESGAVS